MAADFQPILSNLQFVQFLNVIVDKRFYDPLTGMEMAPVINLLNIISHEHWSDFLTFDDL